MVVAVVVVVVLVLVVVVAVVVVIAINSHQIQIVEAKSDNLLLFRLSLNLQDFSRSPVTFLLSRDQKFWFSYSIYTSLGFKIL